MNEATNNETTTSDLNREFTPRARSGFRHDPAFLDALLAYTEAQNSLFVTPHEDEAGTPQGAMAAALAHQKASQAAEVLFHVIDQFIAEAAADYAQRTAEGKTTEGETAEKGAA